MINYDMHTSIKSIEMKYDGERQIPTMRGYAMQRDVKIPINVLRVVSLASISNRFNKLMPMSYSYDN